MAVVSKRSLRNYNQSIETDLATWTVFVLVSLTLCAGIVALWWWL